MRVLIACEESQAVCLEFRKLGHEAFSCDTQECSGGFPEWHIKGDVINIIKGGFFNTQNGDLQEVWDWDLMIAFPPCTHLAVSGAAWFEQKIKDGRQQEGINFFMKIINAPIHKIAVENPIGIMSSKYKKPSQIIQPYYFGDASLKSTCLWLKNLTPLFHAKNVDLFNSNITHVKPNYVLYNSKKNKSGKSKYNPDFQKGKDKAKIRSKTFPGIAKAMAQQWGKI